MSIAIGLQHLTEGVNYHIKQVEGCAHKPRGNPEIRIRRLNASGDQNHLDYIDHSLTTVIPSLLFIPSSPVPISEILLARKMGINAYRVPIGRIKCKGVKTKVYIFGTTIR